MGKTIHVSLQPLIKGSFNPDDARQIVNSLFQSKIQFHAIASLSISERTGGDVSFHKNRIAELSQSLKELFLLIDQADKEGCHLDIQSDIKIALRKNAD